MVSQERDQRRDALAKVEGAVTVREIGTTYRVERPRAMTYDPEHGGYTDSKVVAREEEYDEKVLHSGFLYQRSLTLWARFAHRYKPRDEDHEKDPTKHGTTRKDDRIASERSSHLVMKSMNSAAHEDRSAIGREDFLPLWLSTDYGFVPKMTEKRLHALKQARNCHWKISNKYYDDIHYLTRFYTNKYPDQRRLRSRGQRVGEKILQVCWTLSTIVV